MGTTQRHQLPYPEISDPPDGATQIGALAAAVDTALPFVQAGTVSVTASDGLTGATAVVFPRPFAAPPVVVCGSESNVFVATLNTPPTASGFTAHVRRFSGSGSAAVTRPVHWIAIGNPA